MTIRKDELKEWYPSPHQLQNPGHLESAFRETLRQLYTLRRKVNEQAKAQPAPDKTPSPFPPGSGPSDTFIGGIPVEPFDVNTLNDGDTLQYDKANRRFVIKT